ncbi:MAG: hypothetical protein ABIA78_00335 [archaeon]
MLSKKEASIILAVILVLTFAISLIKSLEIFLYTLASVSLIIIINIVAKKVASFYLDSEIDIKLWEISRYGWTAGQHFKRPVPAGVLFPIIFTVFSRGYFTWMAPLVFDVKPKVYRAAKRYGLYKFSEMTEYHIGLIAAAGIFANLFFALIGYLIATPEPMNFVKLSIIFTFFNMLPLSDLDGNKILFGSKILWSLLASIVLITLTISLIAI